MARGPADGPYTLTHDIMLVGPTAKLLGRIGFIHANRDNAATALRAGAVVLDFPGGDYEAYRPTWSRNVVDFCGRTEYARTAIDDGVAIMSVVLAPIDVVAQFGEDPDVDEVDAHVRRVMQKGLDELAAKRRFPILG